MRKRHLKPCKKSEELPGGPPKAEGVAHGGG